MPLVARTRTRASEGFMGTPSLRFKPGAVCHVCSLRQRMSSAALDRLVASKGRRKGLTSLPGAVAGPPLRPLRTAGRETRLTTKSRWDHHPDFSGGFPSRF